MRARQQFGTVAKRQRLAAQNSSVHAIDPASSLP